MEALGEGEVRKRLLPGWELKGGAIEKTFEFQSFRELMFFVNACAVFAEDLYHHPDMEVRWRKLTVRLTTHKAGGVTEQDMELAQRIERLWQQEGKKRHDAERAKSE